MQTIETTPRASLGVEPPMITASAVAASPIGAVRRPPPRRRRWRGLAVIGLLLVVACGTVPEPPPTETERLDVVAEVAIAAAQVEFLRPAGTTLVAVEPLRPGLLVRTATSGDRIRVAWVGRSTASGAQVRLVLARPEDSTASPEIVSAGVYASGSGPDLGRGVLVWEATEVAAVLDAPLAVPSVDHGADITLLATFADHPLGDLDADGVLSVRDGLVLLDRLADGGWSDFTRYHADLDADDVSDDVDVQRLLDKLVDPALPAGLHVKPRAFSFVELDPATDRDAIVLVANQGRAALSVGWDRPAGIAVEQLGGIVGQSAALRVTLPEGARVGWRPGFLVMRGAGDEASIRLGNLVLLIAGQSNASGRGEDLNDWPHGSDPRVRLFGNDYRWRTASEPHDDGMGQVDSVSHDARASYSFATRLGELLVGATGFDTYLIPAALGGSTVSVGWQPGADLLARNTLLGSANYRGLVSAGLRPNPVTGQPYTAEGGPVSAIVWYQGESDVAMLSAFVANTDAVMDAFGDVLRVPVIFVQLATNCRSDLHLAQHAVGERQRRMETGSGNAAARPELHMVVAFDLPRSDCIHLSAYGQRVLAERIDLAIREHVLGEDVDGTGPRLSSMVHAAGSSVITLRTTRHLASDALDPALFTVIEGSEFIPVSAVGRDPIDPMAVRITLARAPTTGVTPQVRYMGVFRSLPGPENDTPSNPELWERVASGTIRSAEGGLPLPAFGPLAVNASF